jgi:uncharacterized protein YegP (UPF0339 family)
LVEQLICNHQVASSKPAVGTKTRRNIKGLPASARKPFLFCGREKHKCRPYCGCVRYPTAYFNLKAANHQVIGSSQMYASTSSRDSGIAAVKAGGRTKDIRDNC